MSSILTDGGVKIEYESIGDDSDPPVLLVEGLGAQMIGWRREWCDLLAEQGFWVIRFDNRDSGLSEKFPGRVYLLEDMADDVVGVLECLDIAQAHIVGQSLGGMIAQELAIRWPARVASLCLIYTAPNLSHVLSDRDHAAIASRPRAKARDVAIDQYVQDEQYAASVAYEFDIDWIRELGGRMWDRCYYPEGIQRQMDAMQRSGDRTEALRAVNARTLLIHGDADRLISVSGSHALAAALPRATLKVFPGVGHELPVPLWPAIVGAIADNARGASGDDRGGRP